MGDLTQVIDNVPQCGELERSETFVDAQGIVITALTDATGSTRYLGQLQVATQGGPATLGFKIPDAATPQHAAQLWQECARGAIRELAQQMKDNQRRIVLPTDSARPTAPVIPFARKLDS